MYPDKACPSWWSQQFLSYACFTYSEANARRQQIWHRVEQLTPHVAAAPSPAIGELKEPHKEFLDLHVECVRTEAVLKHWHAFYWYAQGDEAALDFDDKAVENEYRVRFIQWLDSNAIMKTHWCNAGMTLDELFGTDCGVRSEVRFKGTLGAWQPAF
jgi:hypothetical protein